MKILLLLLLLSFAAVVHAQSDFINDDHELRPGLYLDFSDFINNTPIEVRGIDPSNHQNHQYYYDLLSEDVLPVHQGDSVTEIDPRYIWGFADGRSVYINRLALPVNLLEIREDSKTPWARINMVGRICLIHYLPYMSGRVVQYPGATLGLSSARTRASEYLLDTREGRFYRPTLGNLAYLIRDDEELYEEFLQSTEDKVVRFYTFLRRYNQRHPLNMSPITSTRPISNKG